MGRIRKRRFAAFTLVGLVPTTLLGAGIARGDLPMNLAISGQDISGTIGLVEAEGIQVFPRRVSSSAGDLPTAALRVESSVLSDVCLATIAHGVPVLGDVTMTIRVPGPNTTARSVVLDAVSVGGSIDAADVRLGVDVSQLEGVETSLTPGMAMGGSVMTEARVRAVSMTATSMSVQGLQMDVRTGAHEC